MGMGLCLLPVVQTLILEKLKVNSDLWVLVKITILKSEDVIHRIRMIQTQEMLTKVSLTLDIICPGLCLYWSLRSHLACVGLSSAKLPNQQVKFSLSCQLEKSNNITFSISSVEVFAVDQDSKNQNLSPNGNSDKVLMQKSVQIRRKVL